MNKDIEEVLTYALRKNSITGTFQYDAVIDQLEERIVVFYKTEYEGHPFAGLFYPTEKLLHANIGDKFSGTVEL